MYKLGDTVRIKPNISTQFKGMMGVIVHHDPHRNNFTVWFREETSSQIGWVIYDPIEFDLVDYKERAQ